MCGIAGFAGRGDAVTLRSMTDRLAYRGPDAEGFDVDPARATYLGHRRLSILDLAGGAQPMSTSDGVLTIVFNGEIYNFADLRRELESLGHAFSSDHSDTEVLLLGYRQWGRSVVSRLNGMWAFAILDRSRGELFLSRDRFGKKPLYYHAGAASFVFASELGALREHPDVPQELDPSALRKYYAYGYVPAPATLLRNVSKLPAGCSLVVELQELRLSHHVDWRYVSEPEPQDHGSAERLGDELEALLDAAVRRRLVADVPVGVFLSGGIDSSLVSALAIRHTGSGRLKAFSIGFEEADFDETRYARDVAAHIGARHSVEILSIQRALDILPDITSRLDEPFADSSLLPTYLLCRHARREVTVAIGGDGADELFAGYDPFRALAYAKWYSRIVPCPIHSAIALAATRLPVSHGYMSRDFRIKRMLSGLAHPEHMRLPVWMAPLSQAQLSELFDEPVALEELYSDAIQAWDGCASSDPVDRATEFFIRFYLQEDILPKVDRASMLNSLEVRAPFLDIDVVDFARKLPAAFKLRGGQTKWLLKRVAERKLPAHIVHRRKQGFAVPIGRWFAEGQLLIDPARSMHGSAFWASTLAGHQAGRADHRLALWAEYLLTHTMSPRPLHSDA